MCGRYVSSKTTGDLLAEFDAVDETGGGAGEPDYNVAPTTDIRIVVDRAPREEREAQPVRQLRVAHWGLVPSWAKDAGVGNRMFNARAESMTSKSAFTRAFAVRRCLVPADGWYEWQKVEGPDGRPAKQAYFMNAPDGHSLGLAGLYEFWRPKDDEQAPWLVSATILTVAAQGPLADIHPRMPLVLPRSDWPRWLDPMQPGPQELLQPRDEVVQEHLELRPVSSRVNRVSNNDPSLLEPAEQLPQAQELFRT
ncbi:MAG TPA: SOS response-associated peptidase [Jatrophihabitans sp.]|nr:SOS response-associated peptidase [Jatrophihabitans sp.]